MGITSKAPLYKIFYCPHSNWKSSTTKVFINWRTKVLVAVTLRTSLNENSHGNRGNGKEKKYVAIHFSFCLLPKIVVVAFVIAIIVIAIAIIAIITHTFQSTKISQTINAGAIDQMKWGGKNVGEKWKNKTDI